MQVHLWDTVLYGDCMVKGQVYLQFFLEILTNFSCLGFLPYFTHKSNISMCLFPQSIAHRICCQTFVFLLVGEKWYFNVILLFISFIISEVEHIFICLNVTLYLFLCELCFEHFPTMLLLFSLLFLRALYILSVI